MDSRSPAPITPPNSYASDALSGLLAASNDSLQTSPYSQFLEELNEYLLDFGIHSATCNVFPETLLAMAGIETQQRTSNMYAEKSGLTPNTDDQLILIYHGLTKAEHNNLFFYYRDLLRQKANDPNHATHEDHTQITKVYFSIDTIRNHLLPLFKEKFHQIPAEKYSEYQEASRAITNEILILRKIIDQAEKLYHAVESQDGFGFLLGTLSALNKRLKDKITPYLSSLNQCDGIHIEHKQKVHSEIRDFATDITDQTLFSDYDERINLLDSIEKYMSEAYKSSLESLQDSIGATSYGEPPRTSLASSSISSLNVEYGSDASWEDLRSIELQDSIHSDITPPCSLTSLSLFASQENNDFRSALLTPMSNEEEALFPSLTSLPGSR